MKETSHEPAYAEAVDAVFEGAALGPRDVLTLSDEEIVAIEGADAPRVAPLLSLIDQTPQRMALAPQKGARSLAERGLARVDPEASVEGVDATVRTILRMRRSWTSLLLVDQVTAVSRTFTAAYLRADGRTLIEDVKQDGSHRFLVMKTAAAYDNLVQMLTPFPGASDEQGWPIAYTTTEWEHQAATAFADAKVVAVVVGLRNHLREGDEDVDERRLSVYAFEDRTEVALPDGDGRLATAPTSRRQLRRHLLRLTVADRERPRHP